MQPKKQANDDRPEGRKQHRADVVEPRKALQPERGNQVDVHETERCGHLLVDARKADAAIEADVHADLSESPQRLGARADLAHHLLHPNDILTRVFTFIFFITSAYNQISIEYRFKTFITFIKIISLIKLINSIRSFTTSGIRNSFLGSFIFSDKKMEKSLFNFSNIVF